MTSHAQTYTYVPEELLALLKRHLPYSLPLLRRLQFAKYKGGITSESRIIIISQRDSLAEVTSEDPFTAVYVDLSGGPETQMWLFSTLEKKDTTSEAERLEYGEQLQVLVGEVTRLGREYGKETTYPNSLLLGTLHTEVRRLLEGIDRITPRASGFYDKWLFKASDLPSVDTDLPEGMSWDTASLEDCGIVISRTNIPRTAYVTINHGREKGLINQADAV